MWVCALSALLNPHKSSVWESGTLNDLLPRQSRLHLATDARTTNPEESVTFEYVLWVHLLTPASQVYGRVELSIICCRGCRNCTWQRMLEQQTVRRLELKDVHLAARFIRTSGLALQWGTWVWNPGLSYSFNIVLNNMACCGGSLTKGVCFQGGFGCPYLSRPCIACQPSGGSWCPAGHVYFIGDWCEAKGNIYTREVESSNKAVQIPLCGRVPLSHVCSSCSLHNWAFYLGLSTIYFVYSVEMASWWIPCGKSKTSYPLSTRPSTAPDAHN